MTLIGWVAQLVELQQEPQLVEPLPEVRQPEALQQVEPLPEVPLLEQLPEALQQVERQQEQLRVAPQGVQPQGVQPQGELLVVRQLAVELQEVDKLNLG